MANSEPLVSIGMPVYNGAKYLRQALDSLLSQGYENFELIISDNASTDETDKICQEYSAKDKRIRYYRNEENLGFVNFNLVLSYSKGEYFMWAASDDMWERDYIKTLLQSLVNNHRGVLAFSAFDNIDEYGLQTRTYPHLFELPSEERLTRLRNYINQEDYLGKANPIYGLMRRAAIYEAGGFKKWGRGTWGVDMLIVFRLLSLGDLVLSPDLLFHKRLVLSDPKNQPRKQRPAFPIGRLLSLYSFLKDWHGYFTGYANIIDIIDTLGIKDKTKLRAALWSRSGKVYLREIKKAVVSLVIQLIVTISMYVRTGKGVGYE